jgi:pyruvate/2-oxoglutarate dehydrogenase complex dihydrolipoamide dehydrogenase (E3) component
MPEHRVLAEQNIIHSAKVASYFRRSKEFGITNDGFAIDMAGVRKRKRSMVRGLNDMYMENYRHAGAEFIWGTGRFLAPRTVEVTLAEGTTRQLRGANVIVSTGTRAALETIPGLAEAQPLTHIEALELDEIPEHLLVVGGGYVGVEISQAMRRFGSKVTMIDRNGRLMSKGNPDVCEALRNLLADEGIDIFLSARIKQVSGKSGDPVIVVAEQNGIEKVLKGSHVLVATGRNPNTEGRALARATTFIGSETEISPVVEVRGGTCLPGFCATSADAPSTRRTFKNRCWRLRLPTVPYRSGSLDYLVAGPALLSGAIAGRVRSPRR